MCLSIRCAFAILAFLLAPAAGAAAPVARVSDARAAPHLFGTIALPVTRTPYDAKWARAGISSRRPVYLSDRMRTGSALYLDLAKVNSAINRRVSFRADSSRHEGGDAWSPASRTLARGAGDCEDYAIAKGQSLLALGFPAEDIYLVIGKHLALRSAHAVLAVRVDADFWILDNLSKQVVRADQFRNFVPVITFSADRKWIHGYRSQALRRLADSPARSPIGSADGRHASRRIAANLGRPLTSMSSR